MLGAPDVVVRYILQRIYSNYISKFELWLEDPGAGPADGEVPHDPPLGEQDQVTWGGQLAKIKVMIAFRGCAYIP